MNPFLEQILAKVNAPADLPKADKPIAKAEKPNFAMGKIYAEWCGHCTALAPKWKIVKNVVYKKMPKNRKPVIYEIESETMDAELAKINENRDSSQKVELQGGYPTIFKIVDGKLSYYEGPREVSPMVQWFLQGVSKKSKNGTKGHKKSHKNRTRKNRL